MKKLTLLIFLFSTSLMLDCYAQNTDFEKFQNQKSVLVFLSPDCPISQKYTLTLKNLHKEFEEKRIHFYAVFAGNYYTDSEIEKFKNKYQLAFNIIRDRNFELVKKTGATITPEVFLLDENLQIVYSGAIDNWYVSLSKKRSVITEHYLKEALTQWLEEREILVKKTEAVGCIIEMK